MKKFIWLKEENDGCDYTIACGKDWEFLQAESIEDAIQQAKDKLSKDYREYGDPEDEFKCDLDQMWLLEVSALPNAMVSVDMEAFVKEVNKGRNKILAEKEEKKARTMYKKLRKRFGD
jgi:hypothetical protein